MPGMAIHDRSSPQAPLLEWTDCCGTAYVIDPASELPLDQTLRPDLPQFTSRHLDASFLFEVHAVLLGRKIPDIEGHRSRVAAGGELTAPKAMERVASAVRLSGNHSIVLYACSAELCTLLAALDEQRIADMSRQWHDLVWPSRIRVAKDPVADIDSILGRLASLARNAVDSGRRLMVRVEYQRSVRDAETGRLQGNKEVRH
jgi:hypothetical protein